MTWWVWCGRRCNRRTSRCGCASTRAGRRVNRQTSCGFGSPKLAATPSHIVCPVVRLRVWMHQSCAVDLVGLDGCHRAASFFSAEGSKPVSGLVGGVHLLLVLPQAHREHLAALWIAKEQAAAVTGLRPECRDDVVFDRAAPLL